MKFVGRDEKLEELHVQLQSGKRLAITAIKGMGGIGKTELALQYAIAQFEAGRYPGGICWLRAREQEVATQITAFAQTHLGLTLPELEIDGQVRYCWQHWPAGEVLVVIDDVTGYDKIEAYLPPSDPRFRLLLTTRLNLGRSVESFDIEELDEASALALLEGILADGRVQAQWAKAKELCGWVGYLPLGLELLGRYLADDEDLSIQELLEELEETRLAAEALQEVAPGMTANLGVLQALELSWRELSEQARDLACVLGMFAAAPIPWELVEKCLEHVDGKVLRKARQKELLYRSLLKRVGEGQYQLHQIVQAFLRVKLEQEGEMGEAIKA
ncbi:MAG: NB-ARC domain-containing protein, partial [Phormidesmis sp.]